MDYSESRIYAIDMEPTLQNDIVFGGSIKEKISKQTYPIVAYFQTEINNTHLRWFFTYKHDATVDRLVQSRSKKWKCHQIAQTKWSNVVYKTSSNGN
ncbi:UNKNOWN [Stylonychia lemnae]|uniref:Uncharacterized protein n=1 Tax=Stylonychia lemnae TaxID=5949 RepID=A0A078AMV6_STYLE|nr:UNKNOWN [Stylonychia lemnae]|eukprot:CDW83256.1 UNKNOWN [Stylonychia lemnae]